MDNFDNIIFDFDGVIVDSFPIKSQSFVQLFSECSQLEDSWLLDFYQKNQGVTRYDMFQSIYKHILNIELDITALQKLSDNFSKLIKKNIQNCALIPGVLSFIQMMYNQGKHLFILSAAPIADLEFIVQEKQIKKYFNHIYGSPTKKIDNSEQLFSSYKLEPTKSVIIGDALMDYTVAQHQQTNFIGISSDSSVFPPTVPIFKNFIGILQNMR